MPKRLGWVGEIAASFRRMIQTKMTERLFLEEEDRETLCLCQNGQRRTIPSGRERWFPWYCESLVEERRVLRPSALTMTSSTEAVKDI